VRNRNARSGPATEPGEQILRPRVPTSPVQHHQYALEGIACTECLQQDADESGATPQRRKRRPIPRPPTWRDCGARVVQRVVAPFRRHHHRRTRHWNLDQCRSKCRTNCFASPICTSCAYTCRYGKLCRRRPSGADAELRFAEQPNKTFTAKDGTHLDALDHVENLQSSSNWITRIARCSPEPMRGAFQTPGQCPKLAPAGEHGAVSGRRLQVATVDGQKRVKTQSIVKDATS